MKASSTMVTIKVSNEDALVDDVITITIECLQKNQNITVRAEIDQKGNLFAGSGCFVADDNGVVDVSKQSSSSGTYTGVSPMGLFWSMRSSPNMPTGLRLIVSNASYPLVTDISVFSGHLTFEQTYNTNDKLLASKQIRRWYMAKGVQRFPVRSGRVRGTLFLPKGRGPFPGVIDMFGMVGACVEFRAALLASRGFSSLALPYFLYDDLPKNITDVELEYFMEAIDWFLDHPHVDDRGLGVLGVSRGGEIALQMAYYSSKIKAVVSINGAPFLTCFPMKYKGENIGESIYDVSLVTETEEGFNASMSMDCDIENYLPIWERDVNILLIGGTDDKALQPKILRNLYNCYPANRKHLCQLHAYAGAGHLIEPPFAPLARSTKKNYKGVIGDFGVYYILWGGETVAHAHAQEDSWRRILNHFRTTLPDRNTPGGTNSQL